MVAKISKNKNEDTKNTFARLLDQDGKGASAEKTKRNNVKSFTVSQETLDNMDTISEHFGGLPASQVVSLATKLVAKAIEDGKFSL